MRRVKDRREAEDQAFDEYFRLPLEQLPDEEVDTHVESIVQSFLKDLVMGRLSEASRRKGYG